jgi:hypothetical protein
MVKWIFFHTDVISKRSCYLCVCLQLSSWKDFAYHGRFQTYEELVIYNFINSLDFDIETAGEARRSN